MKRLATFGLLILALTSQALAANPVFSTGRGRVAMPRLTPLETTAATTLYVSSTGNDSGWCTASGTGACLTIQGAFAKLPKRIRHPVVINVGAGNFAGAQVSGFTIDAPVSSTAGAYLHVLGTYAAATAATGASTGTATSGTAGSGSTFGTIVQTGAGWTSNDFAGKLLHTIAGTGLGQYMPIQGNTADTVTVVGSWTAPASGTTFEILDWGTVINSSISTPATPLSAESVNAQAFLVTGNIGNHSSSASTGPVILFEALKVAPTGGGAGKDGGFVVFEGPRTAIRRSYVVTPSTAGAVRVAGEGSLFLFQSVIENTSTANVLTLQGPNCSGINIWVKGGGVGLVLNGLKQGTFISSYFSGQSLSSVTVFAGLFSMQFNSNKLVGGGGSTKGITIQMSSTNQGISGLSSSSTDISSYGTGLTLDGPHFVSLAAVTGTSNTTAVSITKGARLAIASSVTLTGTTEVSIDGTTSDWATMRAASPKLIDSPYGTIFYE